MNPASEFAFALTNPGTERALKQEVEISGIGWRLSYQRRGFVTFKADKPFTLDSLNVEIACARRLCVSLGKAMTREAAVRLLGGVKIIQHARFFDRKMQGVSSEGTLSAGDLVGTVVELGPEEFWAGVHRHSANLSPDPAGDGGLVMAERSPSRAWLKLEEAVRFFGLNFSDKDIVVELGCAPGGVVLALLDRGVPVIGVDPARMADVVMESSILHRDDARAGETWFYHCRKPAALVSKKDLGQGVTWFMSDMNQSPDVILTECLRFCKMAPSIQGALMTLKLTDTRQVAEKGKWFETLKAAGFKTIRLQQFSVHHKELALLAMR
ncbi:MAG: SAM-dependent methyltransferase [Luteolibacter sp.]